MSTVAFDTLEYVETLKASGFNEEQSKAQMRALSKALESEGIATKYDLLELKTELKTDISELKTDMVKWMVAMFFAISGMMFALLRFLPPS